MKKVLFVATVVKTHINQFHLPYMKKFMELGWQVDVAARNDFSAKETLSILFCKNFWDISFARNPFSVRNIKAYVKLKKCMQREQYDLMICNTPVGGALGRLAAKDIKKTKIVYIAHGFHFFKGNIWYKNYAFKNIEKFLAQYTDCLITINDEDFRAAKKFRLRSYGRVYKIDGIGCNLARINSIDDVNIRADLGINETDFVVVTVAEMIPRKNYKTAIRAFSKANIPDSRYLIVGSGRQKEDLEKLVMHLHLEEKVIFLGYRNDVLQILKASNVLLFPSLQEGLGMAIIEAMSAGLPVLVSNVRGPIDCIVCGKSGFAYDPKDVEGFANGLLKIKNMSISKVEEMRAFNKEYARQFGIDNILKVLFEIYDECGFI